MYNDFEQLLEEIVPLNMTIDIGLRYNNMIHYMDLHMIIYKQYTNEQVKNTVLKGE